MFYPFNPLKSYYFIIQDNENKKYREEVEKMTKVEFKTDDEKIEELCDEVRNYDPYFFSLSNHQVVIEALKMMINNLKD